MNIKKVKIFGARQKVLDTKLVLVFLRSLMKNVPKSPKDLSHQKTKFSSEQGISMIQNRDLIVTAQKNKILLPKKLQALLQKRAVRTISGVSPIGILTKPYPCPGKCIYCPTEDRMPKSYMANQPAAARALRNEFHPYKQVKNRIIALEESGHPVSKLEIIVMGGTWSFLPYQYQNWYIRKCFEAANTSQITNDELRMTNDKKDKNIPQIILLTGTCGAGKTTISKLIAKNLGYIHLCQDDIRQNLYKGEHKPPYLKESQEQEKKVYAETFRQILEQIKQGNSVVLETILNEVNQTTTEDFLRFFKKENLDFSIYVLHPHLRVAQERNKQRECWQVPNERVKQLWSQSEKLKLNESITFIDTTDETPKKTFEKHFSNFDIRYSTFPKSLKNLQKINETADKRIIGLTLETRPDFITEAELIRMRKYGCTRIEIGVQTLDDDIQKLTKRGHERKHVIKAMKLMKDFGFKVCFHLMPGLPGSTIEKDLVWMKEVFSNPDFCPDFVKLYPCVVIESAELSQWWKDGRYKPYEDAELIKLFMQWQTFVPEWTRIMRLMRDIPVSNILGGAKFSNLRQIITDQPKKLREIVGDDFYDAHDLDKNNNLFRDIRAREVGFVKTETASSSSLLQPPKLVRRDYKASDGDEVFLSFESPDKKYLFALLRLRKPSGQKFSKWGSVLHNAALIREVHSYGGEISVGDSKGLGQHRGLGTKLIAEAERIAHEEWGLKKMTIIAGVGTREYYRKFGYEEKNTYMVKKLS